MFIIDRSFDLDGEDPHFPSDKSVKTTALTRKIEEQVAELEKLWQQYEAKQTTSLHQTIQQHCSRLQNLLDLIPEAKASIGIKKRVKLRDFIMGCRLSLQENRSPEQRPASLQKLKRVNVSGKGNNCSIHATLQSLGLDAFSAETLAPLVRGNVAFRLRKALYDEIDNHWEEVKGYRAELFSSLAKAHDNDRAKAKKIVDKYCRKLGTTAMMFDHLPLRFLAEELDCTISVKDPTKGDQSDLLTFGKNAKKRAVIFRSGLHYWAMVQEKIQNPKKIERQNQTSFLGSIFSCLFPT